MGICWKHEKELADMHINIHSLKALHNTNLFPVVFVAFHLGQMCAARSCPCALALANPFCMHLQSIIACSSHAAWIEQCVLKVRREKERDTHTKKSEKSCHFRAKRRLTTRVFVSYRTATVMNAVWKHMHRSSLCRNIAGTSALCRTHWMSLNNFCLMPISASPAIWPYWWRNSAEIMIFRRANDVYYSTWPMGSTVVNEHHFMWT